MSKTPIETDLVRTLAALLDETHLTEIEYDTGSIRIRVARQGAPVAAHHVAVPAMQTVTAQPAAAASDDAASHPGVVTSPMVGVAYLAPEPGAARFVDVGSTVSQGQTLMLIEAMKTFNAIQAPKAGKVVRIVISDGQPVEFGEPLIIIE